LINKYSKEFLNKTIETWQPYSLTPLSLYDAREIADNMTALFNFLIDNDRKTGEIQKESFQNNSESAIHEERGK